MSGGKIMARRLKAREALEDFLGKQAKGMSERTIADKGADSEEAKWSEDDWKNSIYDVLKEHGTEFDKDDWAEAFEDYEDENEDTGTVIDDTTTETETETETEDEGTGTGDATETETEVVDDTTDTSNDDTSNDDTSDSKGYDIDKYNVYFDGSEDDAPVGEGSEDDELVEYTTDKSDTEDDESDDSTQRNIADTLANLRL